MPIIKFKISYKNNIIKLLAMTFFVIISSLLIQSKALGSTPIISNLTPANGITTSTSTPTVSAYVQDPDKIGYTSVIMTIDDIPVPLTYVGDPIIPIWDSCGLVIIRYDPSPAQGTYSYTPTQPLAQGLHSVKLTVKNTTNGINTQIWVFSTPMTPPVIQSLIPNGKTNNTMPTITGTVVSQATIDPGKIVLSIDGINVTASWYSSTKTATYTPTSPLADGIHNIAFSVTDINGLSASATSSITIDHISPNLSWQGPTGTINAYTFVPEPSYEFGNPTTWVPLAQITATDSGGINDKSFSVTVNGSPVTAGFKFGGYWSYDGIYGVYYWTVTDTNTGYIQWNPSKLGDGPQIVTVNVADTFGNVATKTFIFNVAISPVISAQTPAVNAKINNTLTPTISVNVTDNSAVNTSNFVMKVNGLSVPTVYNATTGTFSYTPLTPLTNEAYVTVEVTAYDVAGNSSTTSWQFYDYNYPDMPISTDSSQCVTCHIGYPVAHPVSNCNSCHNAVGGGGDMLDVNPPPSAGGPISQCWLCHGPGNHGAKVLNGGLDFYDMTWITFPKCADCHFNYYNYPSIPHPKNHKDTFSAAIGHTSPVLCKQCHSTTLTREHARYNDPSTGKIMTCATCHASPPASMATSVQKAIITQNQRCDACHTANDMLPKHIDHSTLATFYGQGCFSCHNQNLATINEHNKAGNTCTICHTNPPASMVASVQNAITTKNKDCAACHIPHPNNDNVHISTFVLNANVDCINCHKTALNQEHIGKKDSYNNPINCATCHSSTDINVINAIKNFKTNCDACHTIHPNLDTNHTVSYPVRTGLICADCHTKDVKGSVNPMTIISGGHLGRKDSTSKLMTCNTCHNNTNYNGKSVSGIIATYVYNERNKITNAPIDCSTCHTIHPDKLPVQHTTTYPSSNNLNCADCHTTDKNNTYNPMSILSAGHLGRNGSNNLPMTCDTCHNNTTFQIGGVGVKDYIANIVNNNRLTSTVIKINVTCDNCHGNIHPAYVEPAHTTTYPTLSGIDCSKCHSTDIYGNYRPMNIISTAHVNRKDLNGLTMTCATCHNNTTRYTLDSNGNPTTINLEQYIKTFETNKLQGIAQNQLNCAVCHGVHTNLNTPHTSNYISNKNIECSYCHQTSLNVEHLGKLDSLGKTIYCNTCHASTAPQVITAIANNKSNCDACHTIHPDLNTKHTVTYPSSYGLNCAECHTNDPGGATNPMTLISNGHLGRYAFNGQKMTCDTCHNNTTYTYQGKTVKSIIDTYINNKFNKISNPPIDCSTCHGVHADTTKVHTTVYPIVSGLTCSNCHNNLNVLNNHVGQTAKDGSKMECNTCHGTGKTLPKDNTTLIQSVIHQSKDLTLDCISCHNVHADVDTTHASNFMTINPYNLSCLGCHQSSLNLEHIGKKDKSGTDITCSTCHTSQNNGVQAVIKTNVTNCDACHNKNVLGQDIHPQTQIITIHNTIYPAINGLNCANCHSAMSTISSGHVGKFTSNNMIMDCNTCHAVGATTPKDKNVSIQSVINQITPTNPVDCSSCHVNHTDTVTSHASNYVTTKLVECSGCHDNNLSVEHAKRIDLAGRTMDCTTCHASTNAQVLTAIRNNNTYCDACHTVSHNDANKIEISHAVTVTSYVEKQTFNCSGCHQTNLAIEHMSRLKPDGTHYDCNTCHEDPQMINQSSIKNIAGMALINGNMKPFKISQANSKCDTCHATIHNVNEAHYKQYNTNSKSQCLGCHKMHPKSTKIN